jgi:hypothetical protein
VQQQKGQVLKAPNAGVIGKKNRIIGKQKIEVIIPVQTFIEQKPIQQTFEPKVGTEKPRTKKTVDDGSEALHENLKVTEKLKLRHGTLNRKAVRTLIWAADFMDFLTLYASKPLMQGDY